MTEQHQNNLGANIATLRHQQHLTQEQLAELSNITVNYLSKVERGAATQISALTLNQIAAALHVPLDTLVNGFEPLAKQVLGPQQRQLNAFLNELSYPERESLSEHLLQILTFSPPKRP